jgi:hypothetical protein
MKINMVIINESMGILIFQLNVYGGETAPLSFYLFAGFGRSLDSSQVRVTAITEATGNCTLETSPLLQINNNFHYPQTVYLFRSEILQLPLQAPSNMTLLILSNF